MSRTEPSRTSFHLTIAKDRTTTYKYEDTASETYSQADVIAPPPAVSFQPPPAPVLVAPSIRSPSPPRTTRIFEERVVESNQIGGPLTIVNRHGHRSDRDIKAEIQALEAEQRALKLERDAENKLVLADRIRDGDVEGYEIVESSGSKSKDRDVIRVEKDRKGRLALVRSSH